MNEKFGAPAKAEIVRNESNGATLERNIASKAGVVVHEFLESDFTVLETE